MKLNKWICEIRPRMGQGPSPHQHPRLHRQKPRPPRPHGSLQSLLGVTRARRSKFICDPRRAHARAWSFSFLFLFIFLPPPPCGPRRRRRYKPLGLTPSSRRSPRLRALNSTPFPSFARGPSHFVSRPTRACASVRPLRPVPMRARRQTSQINLLPSRLSRAATRERRLALLPVASAARRRLT